MKPVDYDVLVGKLVLEQVQVIHYIGTQGQNACFSFPGKFKQIYYSGDGEIFVESEGNEKRTLTGRHTAST